MACFTAAFVPGDGSVITSTCASMPALLIVEDCRGLCCWMVQIFGRLSFGDVERFLSECKTADENNFVLLGI